MNDTSYSGIGELLPELNELYASFWQGLAQGEVRMLRCGGCDAHQYPPESFCYIWVAVVTVAPQPDRPPERQVFSSGADLRSTNRERNVQKYWQAQRDPILERGLEVWKPVVCAVNGLCLAGGMTLLLATDIRIASEHAMFDLSEVKRGILPANGGTHRTARQSPYAIAMEILLLARRLSAQRVAHFGLINEVVPHDQMMAVAMERARELVSMAPLAMRAIEELGVRGQYMELNEPNPKRRQRFCGRTGGLVRPAAARQAQLASERCHSRRSRIRKAIESAKFSPDAVWLTAVGRFERGRYSGRE